jgi:hypothetical protein
MENVECVLPAEFLVNMEKIPAISCFTNEKGDILSDNESKQRVIFENGKYIKVDPSLKVIIQGSRDEKIEFVSEVMISIMRKELQFGNVLTYPSLSGDIEKFIKETLAEYDPLQLISDLSDFSNLIIKRSIFASGVGIALALFSEYRGAEVKAVGMGCLLHEYGYLVGPKNHQVSGINSLEMKVFTKKNKMTKLILNIVKHHHSLRSHSDPAVDCGKIAIHWASQEDKSNEKRMFQITTRKKMYHSEPFDNFTDLYHLMESRET